MTACTCPTCGQAHEVPPPPTPHARGEAQSTAMPTDTTKPTIRDHLPKLLKLLDLAYKHGADDAYAVQINRYGAADLQLDCDSTAAVDAIADELGIPGPAEMYSGIYTRSSSGYSVFCGYSGLTCSCGAPCDHTSASS